MAVSNMGARAVQGTLKEFITKFNFIRYLCRINEKMHIKYKVEYLAHNKKIIDFLLYQNLIRPINYNCMHLINLLL